MKNANVVLIDRHPGRSAQTIGIARELGTDLSLIHEPSVGVVGTKGDSQCYLGVLAKVDAIHAQLKSRIGTGKGQVVDKPTLRTTNWWKAILERLETAKPDLWLENSFVLLNLGLEGQELFEEMINDLIVKIKKGKTTFRQNWIQVDNNHEERRYVIVGYPYTDELYFERNDMMADIISDEEKRNTKGMLVIGINIDKGHYPYSVLCSKLSSKLFDAEFTDMVSVDEEN